MLVHVSARRPLTSYGGARNFGPEEPCYRDASTGRERPPRPSKINGAYAEGGAPAVRTVESMTGVRVDRYLQLDFRRFIDAVNEVGGVEVCTPRPLRDQATKLDLAPGTHRLAGGPSLQYVRSREGCGLQRRPGPDPASTAVPGRSVAGAAG